MKKVLFVLTMLLSAISVSAQTGEWTNDKFHTRVGFEVKHGSVSFVSGYFADFDIKVDAAGKNLLGTKVDVTIPTKSINTGVEARDNHLRTADFFEVEKYPTMTFKSTRFVATSKTAGKIYGNLTMRGITRPVVLNATLIGKKVDPKTKLTTAGFRLKGSVKRTDFELGPKFIPAAIGNVVTIIVDAEFTSTK